MSKPLFVYGTLAVPEIIGELLSRPISGLPGRVEGYRRVVVKDKLFPAMVVGTGKVDGLLYSDLSGYELSLLDRYEGELYDRIEIPVQVSGGFVMSIAYVVTERNAEKVTSKEWDAEGFIRERLEGYLKIVTQFKLQSLANSD